MNKKQNFRAKIYLKIFLGFNKALLPFHVSYDLTSQTFKSIGESVRHLTDFPPSTRSTFPKLTIPNTNHLPLSLCTSEPPESPTHKFEFFFALLIAQYLLSAILAHNVWLTLLMMCI
ncbi:hypothetical protein BpHYR1_043349 [Brachionus plicatilis]|uniref:Uncharacterized protein n=1 Tax=Brachionus plicatilis TaxID=10195 RepID=A0A3M7RMP1_BRAPC|nr:hypothetical protein BpHYR1_043349 [Brachionus plicatilis]